MSDDEKPSMVPKILPLVTDELAKAIEEHKRNVPFLIEYQKLQATIIRSKYIALIKEGFTAKQALELCKEQNVYE